MMWYRLMLDWTDTKNGRHCIAPICTLADPVNEDDEKEVVKEDVGIAGAHNLFTHTHKGGIDDEKTLDNTRLL